MTTNKAKGTAWETAVCRYLNGALGEDNPHSLRFVKRQAQAGVKDVGDVWASPFALECKDEAKHNFPGYIRQANSEALNAGMPYGVAVVKKRRANAGDAYVVMDLATFARVLAALRVR